MLDRYVELRAETSMTSSDKRAVITSYSIHYTKLYDDEITGDAAERGCAMANAAVEVEEDHPAKRVIREHKLEMARRMRALCGQMGARNPDQLGNSLIV